MTASASPDLSGFSRLGLGGATFGREIDADAAFALLDHARARGVTLVDTAAAYSQGASERIVGAWLASRQVRPGELTVATKLYPPFTPERIAASVAASADRLGLEVLDLVYLHKWDPSAETPAALGTWETLVRSGRVRAVGVSNFTAEQLARLLTAQKAAGFAPVRALQNNHNLAVRDADAGLRALCAAHGIAVVTYSPLGAGFLTGKHRGGVQPQSRFAVAPAHQEVYFNAVACRRLDRLAEVSARLGLPMAHLALAWALHQPGVATVLVGGRTPAHLDQAFAALAFDDPAVFAELESA